MGPHERNVAELASRLREKLVERRRARAAAGEADVEDLTASVGALVDEQARSCHRPAAMRWSSGSSATASASVPLEVLLADPAVEEVMVNGPDRVYVERRGLVEPTEVAFADEEELRNAIERILAPLGRRVDELSPMVDARLADGSRVNVVIPPLAIDGPALSIRRFGAAPARPRRAGRAGDPRRPRSAAAWRRRWPGGAASWSAAAPAPARRRC